MRALCVLLLLALGASSSPSQDPMGVGGGTDALKQSPCSCGPLFYRHGEWLS
ncbi:MAG: hypothetical protein JWL84_1274 [Rhodospirillales bacterium]|jgi:hypothetical protein|nr:hypothetical protein [Rhodospirillales bacterium]